MKVPLVNQPKNSHLCGPCTLEMFYRFHGIKRTARDVWRSVLRRTWGTYTSELGIDLLKQGFKVQYAVWSSQRFPVEYRTMSQRKILKDLRRRARKQKRGDLALTSLANFIKAGGKLEPRIATLRELRDAVKQGNPPLIGIEQHCLYKVDMPGHPYQSGHFVMPVAFKGNRVQLNDPYWETRKPYWITVDELLFAWYSWNGMVLFAKKSA
ncbi:MAG TPA: hypothetical protein VLJ21_02460 [Candidatus Binatia bacterium]|nr:hypothetical protein [Candidatus Binatia bacterium]